MMAPMLVILAPPALVFGWALAQMRHAPQEQPEPVPVKLDA
jgi:hypothetical protein